MPPNIAALATQKPPKPISMNEDSFCDTCNAKYKIAKQDYAACQQIEILEYGKTESHKKNIISLRSNISTCWLVDPFINAVNVGDMICLTAFYFLTSEPKIVNDRQIYALSGCFVCFDMVQVNPFNQILSTDEKMKYLLFDRRSSSANPST